jgi:hypothetical protein
MTVVAITREMGTLGKDVATGLGEALGLPVIYHEIIDHLADRMRVRRSHVVRLLDGKAGCSSAFRPIARACSCIPRRK